MLLMAVMVQPSVDYGVGDLSMLNPAALIPIVVFVILQTMIIRYTVQMYSLCMYL